MRNRAVTVLATLGLALIVLALGGLAFMYSGVYNIAATDPHLGAVRWVLNTTQVRSVKVRGDQVPAPPPVDSEVLEHGFTHYDAMCVICHGAPGRERGEFGVGMNPTPPSLARMAELYSARELFWIIKHGLKMAGMPAFGPTHTDDEIWGIVAFVQQLPDMTAEDYERRAEAGADGSGDDDEHAPGAAPHSH